MPSYQVSTERLLFCKSSINHFHFFCITKNKTTNTVQHQLVIGKRDYIKAYDAEWQQFIQQKLINKLCKN